MKIGNLNPKSNQRLAVYSIHDSSPTLQAAMGGGGGQVPLIIQKSPIHYGNLYGKGTGYGGNVWGKDAPIPTLRARASDNVPLIIADE